MYLRLDQKSKCNKFFYAFCFYFRAYNYFSVVFISFMCYIRALFLTIPLAVVAAAAVVLLLHFSSHFIHCESTCGILKYSEAKNGQIYLKTVMRMNITVSVNKSFFLQYGVWRYVFMSLFFGFSRFSFGQYFRCFVQIFAQLKMSKFMSL